MRSLEMAGAPTERWHIERKYRADGESERPNLEGAWTGWSYRTQQRSDGAAGLRQAEIEGGQSDRIVMRYADRTGTAPELRYSQR